MSWVLFGQVCALLILGTLLGIGAHGSILDKRREDAYKRKENGL
jgi:hypothetical protein